MAEKFKMESWDQLSTHIKYPLLISIALTGLITISTTLFYFFAQPVLPIFYSLPRSEQSLVQKEWLFVFPILGLIMTLFHSLLITFFKELETLVLRLFAWTTVVLLFFLFLTLIRIIIITL